MTTQPTHIDAMTLFAILYPKVRLQPGVKVKRDDGTVYRDGTTLKAVEDSTGLMVNFRQSQDRGCRELAGLRGKEFAAAAGRPMVASDIRLAVRPVMDLQAVAFLDDVTDDLAAHLKIETSPGSWHANFILDRLCDSDEIVKIQKYLRYVFGGDPAAIKKLQPRRIPTPGLRTVVYLTLPLFSADRLLMQYTAFVPKTKALAADSPKPAGTMSIFDKIVATDGDRTVQREEPDFDDAFLTSLWLRKLHAHARMDRSRADFGVAVYLLKKSWHPADVRDALLKASDDLVGRKGRNTEWYLEHTVEKAKAYIDTR